MEREELLNLAAEAGGLLLSNGAEIYRVEESMLRLFEAYGVTDGSVFAIPSCIYVTINSLGGRPVTRVKRIYRRQINLDRVDRANDVCRRICRERPPYREASRRLREVEGRKTYGFLPQLAAFALVGFAFTLFYGGTMADALCAALCSAVMKLAGGALERFQVNSFFTNMVASGLGALVAIAAVSLGLAANSDKIIIGALMNLVPGIVITTFMRDMMAGDVVAGLIRFAESLLVATAIALGVGAALMAPRLLFGV